MLLYGVYVTPWLLVHVALMFVICCNSSPTASTLNDAPATVDWDAKLRAIRGQILSKLGMSAPPRVSASIVANIDIPSGVQQLYDISRELSQRKQRIHRQQIQDEVSRYFAHRVFTVEAEELEEHPCDTWWNQLFKTSLFFSVDTSELHKLFTSDPDFCKVVYAELRLHQTQLQSPASPEATDDGDQLLEVYQLLNCSWTASQKRYLGAQRVSKHASGYVGFDITDGVKDWLENPHSNKGLQLAVHPGETTVYPFNTLFPTTTLEVEFTDDDGGTVEPEKRPKIVVLFQSQYNDSATLQFNDNRVKRQDHTCGLGDTDCCQLQNIFVHFHRDLGFNWIIQPEGYYANECTGACPQLWESDVQHRQIMGLYYTLNPGASVNPCCVARTYQGLDVMYVNETGHVKVKEMTDMSAMKCSCR